MNLNLFKKVILVLITTLVFLNIVNSITYNPPFNVFESEIIDVYNVNNYDYYVNLNIKTLSNEDLDYTIEILYNSENLVVGEDSFSCSSYCERNLQINKIFFGNYKIIIRTKYNNHYYEKILKFKLDLEKPKSKLIMDNIYYVKNGELNIHGKIETNSKSLFKTYFEIYPKSSPNLKQEFNLECSNKCDFSFNLESPILIEDYYINMYSKQGDLQKIIQVKYFEDKNNKIEKVDFESNKIKLELLKRNKISTKFRNPKKIREVNLEEFIGSKRISQNQLSKKKSFFTSLFSSKKTKDKVEIVEFYLNGSSNNKILGSENLKSYKIDKDVVKIILPNNLNKKILINPTIKTLEEKDLENNLLKDSSGNFYSKNDFDSNKLKPGIYSIENNSEINYYAYGLISINTKKPLYKKNELVEFIFVVLDKNGYLYSNANITLNVMRPDGYVEILSVQDRSIISSNKNGVYLAYFNATNIGEYKLFTYTQINGITVEVNSYFNVVKDENLDFEILRDVPVTIDPWQGPFLNNFTITPKLDLNNLIYEFYEYIPVSFDLFETNADKVFKEDDKLVLLWKNLIGSSNPYYIANSPLITPYLYELGNAKIISNQGYFNENRSWLFAIDPLQITSSQVTCTEIWGNNCGDVPDNDNTFDTCPNSASTYMYVSEVTLSANQSYINNDINVTCTFKPYSTGSEEYIYYYDGLVWSQIYSGNAPGSSEHDITLTQTLSNNPGTHWFRCIIDWDGENDNCADGGSYYDNDDVSIEVLNSFLTLISPEGKDYLSNVIITNITTTTNANITYSIDSKDFIDACSNCQSFTNWEIYSKGTHDIEVIALDSATGEENIWTEIFEVLSDNSNTPRNTSEKTCSDTFGFFCGDWPSSSEGDNTFDSCPTSIGGDADENVVEVYINSSVAYINDTVQVTCEFDPYSSGSEEYIYYYNSNSWIQLYSGNPVDGNVHNISVTQTLSSITGVHYFRCIIDWDGENDECANPGSYYDNDDVSIDVTKYVEVPFLLNVIEPQNITYTTNIIDLNFSTTKNATIRYSIDAAPEVIACVNCTNFWTTELFHNGTHTVLVQAIDDLSSLTINKSIMFYVDINYTTSPRNSSERTCSDTFGFFCGDWPATSESDNTFDSCPTSIGADEYVIEVYVNSSSVYVNDTVQVTCEFDPYSSDNEEYIYYYDTNSWTQLYSGSPVDGNIHNQTITATISNFEGTHWFRCIMDWDGENDECADVGSYYDNDDVSIEVIKPIIIPFILSINSPQPTTYNYSDIDLDVLTTKNANISYSLDGGNYINACTNCTNYIQTLTFTGGYHNITFKGIDLENSNIVTDFVEFLVLLPAVTNTTLKYNLRLEKTIIRNSDNLYQINLKLQNINNNQTQLNRTFEVYSFIFNEFNLNSSFTYSTSSRYSTSINFENISDQIYNGTIYRFNISNNLPIESTFDSYNGISNSDNSWNVSFNLTTNKKYIFNDLFLFSFK